MSVNKEKCGWRRLLRGEAMAGEGGVDGLAHFHGADRAAVLEAKPLQHFGLGAGALGDGIIDHGFCEPVAEADVMNGTHNCTARATPNLATNLFRNSGWRKFGVQSFAARLLRARDDLVGRSGPG